MSDDELSAAELEQRERGIGKIEELVEGLERTLPAVPDDMGIYLLAVAIVRHEGEVQYVARELPANCTWDDIIEVRGGILKDISDLADEESPPEQDATA